MEKLKLLSVVQLCPDLCGGGGAEKGTLEIANAVLDADGISYIFSKNYSEKIPTDAAFNRMDFSFGFLGVRFLRNVFTLKNFLKTHQVSILHARSRMPAWVGYFATKGTDVSFITTWHGRHIAKRFSPRWLYNSVLVKADRTIAVSNWSKQEILRQFRKAKVTVIERGADTKVFSRPLEQDVQRFRKLYASVDDFLILFPGRYTPWKGGAFLLNAMKKVKENDSRRWKCVFVGNATNNKYKLKLKLLVKKLGLEDRVFLGSECHDMALAYYAADLVVLPNLSPEPFGRTMVEAQMCGCRVLAANTGAFKETIFDQKDLIKCNDTDNFAERIETIIQDSSRSNALKNERQLWAQKHYDIKKMVAQTLGLYRELL